MVRQGRRRRGMLLNILAEVESGGIMGRREEDKAKREVH
jgi:hypothetical protein